jgi:hypothetical protein
VPIPSHWGPDIGRIKPLEIAASNGLKGEAPDEIRQGVAAVVESGPSKAKGGKGGVNMDMLGGPHGAWLTVLGGLARILGLDWPRDRKFREDERKRG